MGFIENPNSPLAAQQAVRISPAGSVGTIGYLMDGSATLRVVRTVVEFVASKVASRIEVHYVEPSPSNETLGRSLPGMDKVGGDDDDCGSSVDLIISAKDPRNLFQLRHRFAI